MAKLLRLAAVIVAVATLLTAAWVWRSFEDYSERWPENEYHQRDTTCWLIIHHDAIPHPTTPDAIQRWHKDGMEWESGFAYTFYLTGSKIYQCKKIEQSGGHAYGYNKNAVSICVHTPDKYKPATRLNLFLIAKFLMLKYDIDTSRVRGHGELPNQSGTTCPELNMDSLRQCLSSPKKELTEMAKITKEVIKDLAYGYKADGTVIDFTDSPIEEEELDEIEEESDDEEDGFEQDSNENQTSIEHQSNVSQTSVEHRSNVVQTMNEQQLSAAQLQTLAANIERSLQNAIKPLHYVELYPDVIKLLTDRKFVKAVTGLRKPKYTFSVTRKLCQAIRETTNRGEELKDSKIAKIWFSYQYQRRFSPLAFYSVIVACATILALALWPSSPKAQVKEKPKIERKLSLTDLKKAVRKWEKVNHYYFSGWRLSHDIQNTAPDADLDKFLKQQKEIQGASFTEPQKWN